MCFDALFGSGKSDSQKALEQEKASMEAQRKREEQMRNDEMAMARRSAVEASQLDAQQRGTQEDIHTKKKKKLKGISGLRVSKSGLNTASVQPVGSGLVV